MSEYIKALNRLRNTQAAAPALPTSEGEPAGVEPPATLSAPAATPPAAPPRSRRLLEDYKDLYDRLRLVAPSDAARRFVIAGADAQGGARRVITGLSWHIESLGFRVLHAELCLVNGRPILRRRREQSLASLSELGLEFAGDLKPLDLSQNAAQAEVADWLAAASRLADVVLIEGCTLSESVDAALLARSCDGLVVVAQAGVTDRTTLANAAERVRAAGCRALGLVLIGSKHPLPAWVRRFFERPRTVPAFLEE
ncbi:MAG: hypothetical protein HY270_19295 [Deltaproteobacteria bacterium]|nr:hypothetical protein [Deltaproteobacteria bacterium]